MSSDLLFEEVPRREFLAWVGRAGLSAGFAAACYADGAQGIKTAPSAENVQVTVSMPDSALYQNPGMDAGLLDTGDLLVWAGDVQKPFKAYRLNPSAKEIWLLCDGQTARAEVIRRAAAKLRISEAEIGPFIDQLVGKGVLTMGGNVCVEREAGAKFKNGRGVILRPLKVLKAPKSNPL